MKKLISILICTLVCAVALGQEVEVKDYDALRTNTWSLWAGGGIGTVWGGDLMPNINPGSGTQISPFLETGVHFNIRPWVRLGLDFGFSKFNSEQRFDAVQPNNIAFRDLQMLTHNFNLMAEFNLLELFKRSNKRWNLYLGTGLGYRFGVGRDYSVNIGGTHVQDASSLRINEWLEAGSTTVSAKGPYLPVRLSLEYDIAPRFSIGVSGGYDCSYRKDYYLPQSRLYAGVVLRVNLVGNKQGYYTRAQQRDYFKSQYEKAEAGRKEREAQVFQLEDELMASQAKVSKLTGEVGAAKAQISQLEKKLENSVKEQSIQRLINEAVIYFDAGSAEICPRVEFAIKQIAMFLKDNPEYKLYLTGSASKEGPTKRNRELSRERALAVKKALVANGISEDRLVETWVGDEGMTFDPTSRRVVFDLR